MEKMYYFGAQEEISIESEVFKSVGRRIRALRREKGLTLEGLGAIAAICPKYLGEIERGNANPTLLIVLKISKGLERSAAYLFEAGSYAGDEDIYSKKIRPLIHGKCVARIERIATALELLLK